MKEEGKLKSFQRGQIYLSSNETELGVGIITTVDSKTINVFFPQSDCLRTYNQKNAPLKRIIFDIGDEAIGPQGERVLIEGLEEKEGLFYYQCAQAIYPEGQLSRPAGAHRPEEKILDGHGDSAALFDLRFETLEKLKILSTSPVRGLVGGRVSLLPHQFYIAEEVVRRDPPRVLLADEVGLGKTIEAGLILHSLIVTGRVERALILTPHTLVHQWFVEMFRRFQLSFKVLSLEEEKAAEGGQWQKEDLLILASLDVFKKNPALFEQVCAVPWDILVVDEAHRLSWFPDSPSVDYTMVKTLAGPIPSLLLLTGTPEQLGPEGHYARLHLLDPHRFPSYENFLREHEYYGELTQVIRPLLQGEEGKESESSFKSEAEIIEKLKIFFQTRFPGQIDESMISEVFNHGGSDKRKLFLKLILDLFGTGRVFFRNTRDSLKTELSFFPQRIVKSYPMVVGASQEILYDWLAGLLKGHPSEKFLLIVKTKIQVLNIEKALKERVNIPLAVFHSEQSLINRDRQAAYFADPQGAQILLCSEMGSEGRNFQFAHHLILFDLPELPDLLEQRIGRLDRIGQKESIYIHIPYLCGSLEEILFHWYHEGFNAFTKNPKAGMVLYEQVGDLLNESLKNPQKTLNGNKQDFSHLIKETQKHYALILQRYEQGRDWPTEYNSYDDGRAKEILKKIKMMETGLDLRGYLEKVFELLGVHSEDLDEKSCFIKPQDNMYIPHFPGLPRKGLSLTYDRERALMREDIVYLTWDHPMVTGVFELLLHHQIGSASLAIFKEEALKTLSAHGPGLLLEVVYVAECVAPKKLQIDQYFPPTPIRLVLDEKRANVTSAWGVEKLRDSVLDLDTKRKPLPKDRMKDFLKDLLKTAQEKAQKELQKMIAQTQQRVQENFTQEIFRLDELKRKNSFLPTSEKVGLQLKASEIQKAIGESHIRLDSLRLVLKQFH